MEEIFIDNKKSYLLANSPFLEIPELVEKRRCLHCDEVFKIEDYKVFKDIAGDEFICCPNAPDCDGTIIDWVRE